MSQSGYARMCSSFNARLDDLTEITQLRLEGAPDKHNCFRHVSTLHLPFDAGMTFVLRRLFC